MKIEAQLQKLDFGIFVVWCENFDPQNKLIFGCYMHTPIGLWRVGTKLFRGVVSSGVSQTSRCVCAP